MERLIRVAMAAALGIGLLASAPASLQAGGGFGGLSADAVFGEEMTFSATWDGPTPDRVELLLGFGGEERLVVPVELAAGQAEYRRDLVNGYVAPNTEVAYRWRAVEGGQVTLSPERTLLYDDDRPELDWQEARIGSATVHWYGANEDIARRFGSLAGEAADRAAELLGHPLDAALDIFVYDKREEFLGAVGPATREWVGAAAYPDLRTVFMWLGAGSTAYLETTVAHEVTHVVFHDATDNPFHEPAAWLNEGIATWSEVGNAITERDLVSREARSGRGLMAFEALVTQFPIDVGGANLAYAQSATLVDQIIADRSAGAIADIAAAYRDGATDEEAIQDGTGVPFDQLNADFFAAFGVSPPAAVEPLPLERSDVPIPPQADVEPGATSAPEPGSGAQQDGFAWVIIAAVLIGGVFLGVLAVRRARREPSAGPGS